MSLIMLLSANSRLSYADLAEKLNLSVNAVHKRIQLLIESGVIRRFMAKVSLLGAKAIVVYISGTSCLNSFQDLPERMKAQGSIYWLALGGGKFVYVGAYLRDLTELDALVSYIKKEAGIPEPVVGIMSVLAWQAPPMSKVSDIEFCDLDYRIIRSLKDDSRKPISDVAYEVRVSAKTVRRRLSRMVEKGLIELSVEWYPDKSNDIMTLMNVHLKPDVDKKVAFEILKKYAPNTLFFWTYVNLPNVLTYAVWTNSMNELQTLRQKLEKDEYISSVVPNILYTGFIFDTWRDQLVEK
jgi:Lrp/AsnC family leucine-responsive transcriptional regulator